MYKTLLILFVATSLALLLVSDAPEMISRLSVIALIFITITLILSMLFAAMTIKLLATFAVAILIVATVLSPAFRETLFQLWYYANAVLVDLGQDTMQTLSQLTHSSESTIDIRPAKQ